MPIGAFKACDDMLGMSPNGHDELRVFHRQGLSGELFGDTSEMHFMQTAVMSFEFCTTRGFHENPQAKTMQTLSFEFQIMSFEFCMMRVFMKIIRPKPESSSGRPLGDYNIIKC